MCTSMTWDIVMAITQISLDLCLLPTVFRSTSYVPRFTSASAAIGLAIVSLALLNLGAPLGAASAVVGAGLWALIFILHGRAK